MEPTTATTPEKKAGISLTAIALVVALLVLVAVFIMKPTGDPADKARIQLLENRVNSLEAQVAPPEGYHLELMTIWRACDPAVSNGTVLNESECPRVLNAGLARYYVYGDLTMGGFR